MLRSFLLGLLVLATLGGSCSQPSTQPAEGVTRAEFDALRSELAAVKAERDRAKQAAQAAAPTETQPYLVTLPQWYPLGGLYRPAASNWYSFVGQSIGADGAEICFDAQEAAQWFGALNRALGGGQQQPRPRQGVKP